MCSFTLEPVERYFSNVIDAYDILVLEGNCFGQKGTCTDLMILFLRNS